MSKEKGAEETLAIPQRLRDEVDHRDAGFCRMCGKFLGLRRAIHHIWFGGDLQGMGGRRKHDINNLVSLCYLPGDNNCHQRAHSRKSHWQDLLTRTITQPTRVTAIQLQRWDARNQNRNTP